MSSPSNKRESKKTTLVSPKQSGLFKIFEVWMAMKSIVAFGNSVPQLGWGGLSSKSSELSKRLSFNGLPGSYSGTSPCRGTKSFENDQSSKPTKGQKRVANRDELSVSKRLHKDLSSLPSG